MTAQTEIYFNTTNLSGQDLKSKWGKVVGQNGEILEVFANHPHVKYSPWAIFYILNEKAPITSIRRGITTLEALGYLQKTTSRVRCGPYEDFSFEWQLHPDKKVLR
jgi:hypothetical protein